MSSTDGVCILIAEFLSFTASHFHLPDARNKYFLRSDWVVISFHGRLFALELQYEEHFVSRTTDIKYDTMIYIFNTKSEHFNINNEILGSIKREAASQKVYTSNMCECPTDEKMHLMREY